MSRTALVTGGSGFYGSHLCRRLRGDNWRVHATSRSEVEDVDGGVAFHQADFANLDDVSIVLDSVRPDVVFHLAGSASAAPDIDLVLPIHHSHVTSALNLLTIAAGSSIGRIVLVGSLQEPVGDASSAVPSSPYSAAKLAVTHYVDCEPGDLTTGLIVGTARPSSGNPRRRTREATGSWASMA